MLRPARVGSSRVPQRGMSFRCRCLMYHDQDFSRSSSSFSLPVTVRRNLLVAVSSLAVARRCTAAFWWSDSLLNRGPLTCVPSSSASMDPLPTAVDGPILESTAAPHDFDFDRGFG